MKELRELFRESSRLLYHILVVIGLAAFIVFAIIKFI